VGSFNDRQQALLLVTSSACPDDQVVEAAAAMSTAEAQLEQALVEYETAEARYWQVFLDQIVTRQRIARYVYGVSGGLPEEPTWWAELSPSEREYAAEMAAAGLTATYLAVKEQYYFGPAGRAWDATIGTARAEGVRAREALATARANLAQCQATTTTTSNQTT